MCTAKLKADLARYAQAYGDAYGTTVDAQVLIPHMLDTVMRGDRLFRQARRVVEQNDLNAGGDGWL